VAKPGYHRERTVAIPVSGTVRCICPRCHGALFGARDELACGSCHARYSLMHGIPILSLLDADDPASDYKRRQIEFFDREAEEFEITRPAGQPRLYGWLMTEKFRRSVQGLESRLPGASALTVCGGSGMDAELLARAGAIVTASDLSIGAARRAVERGRRAGLPITAVVADVERLPFADSSFDIVYVHDGLHHLSDPMLGLTEMCRVARVCVCVTEPAQAAVTAIAVRLGIAQEEEDAGNRVERLTAKQIRVCLSDHGLRVVGVDRYAMYYQHEPGRWMRFLSRRRTLPIGRGAVLAFNAALGHVGNKLAVRGVRKTAEPPA